MRTVKFMELITRAFEETQALLFNAFDIKRWLRFVLIVFLSGSFVGGFNVLDFNHLFHLDKMIAENDQEAKTSAVKSEAIKESKDEARIKLAPSASSKSTFLTNNILGVVLISLLFLWIISLVIVFTWIASRFEFIYFDALISKTPNIRKNFSLFKDQGDDLFRFYLKSMGIALLLMLMLAASGMGIFSYFVPTMQLFQPMLLIGSIVLGIVLLSVFICWFLIVVNVYVRHFVVSIMAIDQLGFKDAWIKFWGIYKERKKDFLLYILMMMLISLILGMLLGLAMIIALLGVALIGVIVFGSLYVITTVILKSLLAFQIIAVILAIPFMCGLIVVCCGVSLPAAIFVRYFSLYFLSSLNVGYQPVVLLAKTAPILQGE